MNCWLWHCHTWCHGPASPVVHSVPPSERDSTQSHQVCCPEESSPLSRAQMTCSGLSRPTVPPAPERKGTCHLQPPLCPRAQSGPHPAPLPSLPLLEESEGISVSVKPPHCPVTAHCLESMVEREQRLSCCLWCEAEALAHVASPLWLLSRDCETFRVQQGTLDGGCLPARPAHNIRPEPRVPRTQQDPNQQALSTLHSLCAADPPSPPGRATQLSRTFLCNSVHL